MRFLIWTSAALYLLSKLEMSEFSNLLFIKCRNKKKKIPLMNGEEVDMDLSAME